MSRQARTPCRNEIYALMEQHGITRAQVAEAIHVTLVQIKKALLPEDSPSYRPLGEAEMELLRIKGQPFQKI